jgi:hypothetical protein
MPAVKILFCRDPLGSGVDSACAAEAAAAAGAGFGVGTIDHEAAAEGLARRAVRDAGDPDRTTVYRGWMLRAERYEALWAALAGRGSTLVNTPAMYRAAHHLPEGYAAIAAVTPASGWVAVDGDLDEDRLAALGARLGGPVVIKDWVKSRKHEWDDACFVPDARDRAALVRAARRLIELQGPDLTGGIVVRRFVPLVRVGAHPRSGAPVHHELRAFCLDGRPFQVSPSWPGVTGDPPPLEGLLGASLRAVPSRLFTADLALTEAGGWIVVELGDGQVAGLPDAADPADFYRRLAGALAAAGG